jgi:hypothetical protein
MTRISEPNQVRVFKYQEGLTLEFWKFIMISEECEMNRYVLVALGYKDIAEDRDAALKRFEIL